MRKTPAVDLVGQCERFVERLGGKFDRHAVLSRSDRHFAERIVRAADTAHEVRF